MASKKLVEMMEFVDREYTEEEKKAIKVLLDWRNAILLKEMGESDDEIHLPVRSESDKTGE